RRRHRPRRDRLRRSRAHRSPGGLRRLPDDSDPRDGVGGEVLHGPTERSDGELPSGAADHGDGLDLSLSPVQPHRSWSWSDARTEWSVQLDVDARQLHWSGWDKASSTLPAHAEIAGGHSQSFEDYLARGSSYRVPPAIELEIREALR